MITGIIKLEVETKRVEVHDWNNPKETPVWNGITTIKGIMNETNVAHPIDQFLNIWRYVLLGIISFWTRFSFEIIKFTGIEGISITNEKM